jgi:transcriptional regulator with XRE-family HTH domain
MDSIVVNRLKTLMDREKENPNSFATKVGMTSSAVYNLLEGGGTPRAATIDKILAAYPSYSREWLMGIDGKVIETNDNPYRDFVIKKLNDENERLWKLVEKLTGAPVGSFPKLPSSAGVSRSIKVQPDAQLGGRSRQAA